MKHFQIEPGPKTPAIVLDPAGLIEMKGKSIPENTAEFYQPVYEWLDQYALTPQPVTRLLINFEYFNTSSSKCLLDIFRKLEAIHVSGKSSVAVSWIYDEDDEDMMETGEDYKSMVKIPFVVQAG